MKLITDFGKARANKFASALNNAKFSDTCECLDIPVCQDTATAALNARLTGVTIDGVSYNINNTIKDFSGNIIWKPTRYDVTGFLMRGSGASANRPYVLDFLQSILSIYEVDSKLSISSLGVITHIGAYELTINGSGYTQTRCCTVVDNEFVCNIFEGTLTIGGSGGIFGFNSVTPFGSVSPSVVGFTQFTVNILGTFTSDFPAVGSNITRYSVNGTVYASGADLVTYLQPNVGQTVSLVVLP